MANSFTGVYHELQALWDKEARRKLKAGRSPLDFDQLHTIDENQTHQQVVEYLRKTGRPNIVIAASGMCTGGRIVAYLKALIGTRAQTLSLLVIRAVVVMDIRFRNMAIKAATPMATSN